MTQQKTTGELSQRKEDKSPTVPLWRRLNSERTGGNWIYRNIGDADSYAELIGPYGSNKTISLFPTRTFVSKVEAEANAQYTALAVSNFANIVEALQWLIDNVDLNKLNIRKDFSLINAHAQAKKILHSIS